MPDTTDVSATPKPIRARREGDTQKFVASFVLVAFVGVTILLCWHTVPPENKETLDLLIGFIGGAFTGVVGFYFGSTSSSHQKDTAITALAAATPPTQSGV